jgi:predicted HTH transcriptional regulator
VWAPRSWSGISALIGQAEETANLDFKQELSKNPELAKDVSAMTINGGVLIYGVEEDQLTRIAIAIHKFPLSGVEERIRQTIGSRVAPVPAIEVLPITEKPGDSDGILVIVVPPSSSVPHQANHRYPRRSGTTTDYLEEPEVARLYERRRELSGPSKAVGELLDLHVFRDPLGETVPGACSSAWLVCGWWSGLDVRLRHTLRARGSTNL